MIVASLSCPDTFPTMRRTRGRCRLMPQKGYRAAEILWAFHCAAHMETRLSIALHCIFKGCAKCFLSQILANSYISFHHSCSHHSLLSHHHVSFVNWHCLSEIFFPRLTHLTLMKTDKMMDNLALVFHITIYRRQGEVSLNVKSILSWLMMRPHWIKESPQAWADVRTVLRGSYSARQSISWTKK